MSGYKEFEGKTLDEAIRDACAYYNATRDKLEIDILNDAKGGIFGLVGAKKARVRARLVELSSVLEGLDSLGEKGKQKKRGEAHPGEARRGGRREPREEVPRTEPGGNDTPNASTEALFAEAAYAETTAAVADESGPDAPQPAGEKRG
ncbi:MAG: Jag N-terminal domain-containing protein, partial [Deltaproteobacteria bacterium]|nr:Jag N-terminal domain-containing protein [Deltaproteobacteria bacterium]